MFEYDPEKLRAAFEEKFDTVNNMKKSTGMAAGTIEAVLKGEPGVRENTVRRFCVFVDLNPEAEISRLVHRGSEMPVAFGRIGSVEFRPYNDPRKGATSKHDRQLYVIASNIHLFLNNRTASVDLNNFKFECADLYSLRDRSLNGMRWVRLSEASDEVNNPNGYWRATFNPTWSPRSPDVNTVTLDAGHPSIDVEMAFLSRPDLHGNVPSFDELHADLISREGSDEVRFKFSVDCNHDGKVRTLSRLFTFSWAMMRRILANDFKTRKTLPNRFKATSLH